MQRRRIDITAADVFDVVAACRTGEQELRITRPLRSIGIMAAVVVVTIAGWAVPASAGNYGWIMKPGHITRCLVMEGPSVFTVSSPIELTTCNNSSASQYWFFVPTTDGYYRIQNASSKMCMNVQGASSANGTKIIQYPCTTSALNDQFKPRARYTSDTDYYNLVARHNPTKCINVPNSATAAGTNLILYTCTTNNLNDSFTWMNQVWFP